MIAQEFDYAAPTDVASCVAALTEGSRILAGGTWVIPEMDRGDAAPASIVDLRRAGLGSVVMRDGALIVGAMTNYSTLLSSTEVSAHAEVLRLMAGTVTGGWSIRNQGTVGGSAAAARPQSDVPAVLTVCGAAVMIEGGNGARECRMDELLVDAMTTSLGQDELITGFRIPSWAGWRAGYSKIKRGGSSWPIATAASLVRLDPDGVCVEARVALGAVGHVPVLIDVAEALVGTRLDDASITRAGSLAQAVVSRPWADILAPASYRMAIAPVAVRRSLAAAARPEGGAAHAR